MTIENTAGLGVNNHYGPRGTQDGKLSGGRTGTVGSETDLIFYITGKDLVSGSFLTNTVIPKGSSIDQNIFCEVIEAFDIAGTTPTIDMGAEGSETEHTLGRLLQADFSAVGPVFLAPSGDLSVDFLEEDTTISVALGGTDPVASPIGKAKVTIRRFGYATK